jgi:hypothetical protein
MFERDPTAFDRMIATHRAWVAAGRPLTPEQRARDDAHLERTTVEAGGPIPARFKDLQYLNKARGQR